MLTPQKPWERLIGETVRAYEVFWKFLQMGPGRQITKLAADIGVARRNLHRWSGRFQWHHRAAMFDDAERMLELAAKHAAMEKELKGWSDRRKQAREEEWSLSLALLERAKQMLKWPLVKQVVKEEREELPDELVDGKTIKRVIVKKITEVHPARWDFDTATRYIETASKLMRLAAAMPDTEMRITGHLGGPVQVESTVKVDVRVEEVRKRARELLFEKMLNERSPTGTGDAGRSGSLGAVTGHEPGAGN